jgi:hypothetical protein
MAPLNGKGIELNLISLTILGQIAKSRLLYRFVIGKPQLRVPATASRLFSRDEKRRAKLAPYGIGQF